jgi:hypothetical protein
MHPDKTASELKMHADGNLFLPNEHNPLASCHHGGDVAVHP